MQDFDESKGLADSSIIHIDMWKQFSSLPGLEAKICLGFFDADATRTNKNLSYNEYRFELNYLF